MFDSVDDHKGSVVKTLKPSFVRLMFSSCLKRVCQIQLNIHLKPDGDVGRSFPPQKKMLQFDFPVSLKTHHS